MLTTKILPSLMQNTKIWKSQCAKRISETSGSCLFPNVVTNSPQKLNNLCIMHFTLVWALGVCLLAHTGQRSELGKSKHQTSFYKHVLPHLQSIIPLCLWLKQTGWALGTWEAGCGNHPFHFTRTWFSSQEQKRVVSLHLCFSVSGEVRNNSTFLPNLVLASSWEKNESQLCSCGGSISWEAMQLLLTLAWPQLTQMILHSPVFRKP